MKGSDAAPQKITQAQYYDHDVADPEFEINRPHGESRLYQYLMDFKFTHVVRLLGRPLVGSKVLVICCGSGMDAEYLARLGGRIVALDISNGCLERARLRARRYGVDYQLVRGDAEFLPFADASFEYGFVHDGLHHLGDPDRAISELARVARRGIMVTEPAEATVTKLPTRLGLMKPYEQAGNYIYRVRQKSLERLCRSLGFDRVVGVRYLVKYSHPPPAWWRGFDSGPLFQIARAGFLLVGVGLLGRWGNKLALIAERSQ